MYSDPRKSKKNIYFFYLVLDCSFVDQTLRLINKVLIDLYHNHEIFFINFISKRKKENLPRV